MPPRGNQEAHTNVSPLGRALHLDISVVRGNNATDYRQTQNRSRAIRSWLHIGNCAECGDHQTAEPSIDNVHMNLLVGASGR